MDSAGYLLVFEVQVNIYKTQLNIYKSSWEAQFNIYKGHCWCPKHRFNFYEKMHKLFETISTILCD